MTSNRISIAKFCDDVRQEIGNKFSPMGCYGTDLYVPAFPIMLPELCAFVHVRAPRGPARAQQQRLICRQRRSSSDA
jgi:hypothetical protein